MKEKVPVMKHIFILNPAAGKSDQTPRFTQDIERICGARGLDYEICVSKAPGDCRALARRAAESGHPVVTGNMDETLIVTYSPKYKAYQRRIRDRQIEHAEKIINTPGRKRKGKNQNDPMRFVKKTSVTPDGEIANKQVYNIDEEQIQKEEMYDGFYAVITNLEGDVSEIIRINKQRWEIEENFRIMKTEFEARPVYVRREERIKAHFMTCYISLLLYRLLEKKLGDAYTVSQILGTLRSMQMTLLNTASGYIPSYTRTELTDSLHKTFGFRTDYEFITKASMRTIIKETKQIKSKKS